MNHVLSAAVHGKSEDLSINWIVLYYGKLFSYSYICLLNLQLEPVSVACQRL